MDRHERVISCFSVYVSHHYTRRLSHCAVTNRTLSAVLHKILAPLFHIRWWTQRSQVRPWRWSHTARENVHERSFFTSRPHTPRSRDLNHERLPNRDLRYCSPSCVNSAALTLFLWLYFRPAMSFCKDGRDSNDGGFIWSDPVQPGVLFKVEKNQSLGGSTVSSLC